MRLCIASVQPALWVGTFYSFAAALVCGGCVYIRLMIAVVSLYTLSALKIHSFFQ